MKNEDESKCNFTFLKATSFLDNSLSASLLFPPLEETAWAWLAANDAENLEYVVFGGISLTVLLLVPRDRLGATPLLNGECWPPSERGPTPYSENKNYYVYENFVDWVVE